MKKLVTVFVLGTLLAAPAFAKPRHAISPQAAAAQASMPYDQYSPMADRQTVVANGQMLGRDPDAGIRSTLLREGNPANIAGN